MLAIWSLVPLPFPKPAWTSGSSRFTYCWSLAWRILSITLLCYVRAPEKCLFLFRLISQGEYRQIHSKISNSLFRENPSSNLDPGPLCLCDIWHFMWLLGTYRDYNIFMNIHIVNTKWDNTCKSNRPLPGSTCISSHSHLKKKKLRNKNNLSSILI